MARTGGSSIDIEVPLDHEMEDYESLGARLAVSLLYAYRSTGYTNIMKNVELEQVLVREITTENTRRQDNTESLQIELWAGNLVVEFVERLEVQIPIGKNKGASDSNSSHSKTRLVDNASKVTATNLEKQHLDRKYLRLLHHNVKHVRQLL